MGPHLTPPVASPFFLLPCRLSLCLQGAEQEGYHFPSQSRAGFLNGALTVTRGNLRPAAAARRAPSLSVPICAILQSGGKSYLPGLEAGGGGSWRRGGRLQVLWVLQKAQGSVQQLVKIKGARRLGLEPSKAKGKAELPGINHRVGLRLPHIIGPSEDKRIPGLPGPRTKESIINGNKIQSLFLIKGNGLNDAIFLFLNHVSTRKPWSLENEKLFFLPATLLARAVQHLKTSGTLYTQVGQGIPETKRNCQSQWNIPDHFP
nr:uncharacterized protein LOC121823824 [Peromyscus maniculatus bairdii]